MLENQRENLIKIIYHHRLLRNLIDFPDIRKFLNKLCYQWSELKGESLFQVKIFGKSTKFSINDRISENYLKSVSEAHLVRFLMELLKTSDCFYDIGAEIGFYSLFLAQVVKEKVRVIAFEHEENQCKWLCQNLKINNLSNVYSFSWL